MTLPEITAAVKSIGVAVKIAKGFSELKSESDIISATIELKNTIIDIQNNLLSIQSSYGELLDSKSQLENKIIDLEDWNTTKLNYSLIEITPGVHVYLSQESQEAGNKHPWFCAKCYNRNELSPFQRHHPSRDFFLCHSCGSKIELPQKEKPSQNRKRGGWMSA